MIGAVASRLNPQLMARVLGQDRTGMNTDGSLTNNGVGVVLRKGEGLWLTGFSRAAPRADIL